MNNNTNNALKELTDFLDTYDVDYEVVGDRVVAEDVELDHRGIPQLPDSIGYLQCQCLYLSNNKLTSLPDNFGNLKCRRLSLSNNQLTQLPESIGNLTGKELHLSYNNLTQLPESIGNLKCEYLGLSYNNITAESKQLLKIMKSNGVDVLY